MIPSHELFNLIKSLSKSEKRYFKMYSALQSGEKNYIKLFDAVEKQNQYDEEAIKNKFKNETFINHLPSEKNHLYGLILKSLRTFQTDNSVNSFLRDLLKDIEILYFKALYKECNKVVNRAKKIAYEVEKFYYVLEIINWEKLLADEQTLFGSLDKNLEALNIEEQKVLDKLSNIAEYQLLYSKINYVFRAGGYSRTEIDRKLVDEVADNYLIKGKNTAISGRATSMCYYIKGLCAITNSNLLDAKENFEKVILRIEKNPQMAKDLQRRYLRTLNYLMNIYIELKLYPNFRLALEKMKLLCQRPEYTSVDLKVKIFTYSNSALILECIKRGEFKTGVALIKGIEMELKNFEDSIHKEEEVLFNFYFSVLYFGAADYKNALFWINKVINDSDKSGLRLDLFSFARIFNIVIHFELGNTDLLEYLIKSSQRYHIKLKREYQFENTVLKLFKRLAKELKDEGKREVFLDMKTELTAVLKDPNEKNVLQYFDFMSWIDSKLNNILFAESLRSKQIEAMV